MTGVAFGCPGVNCWGGSPCWACWPTVGPGQRRRACVLPAATRQRLGMLRGCGRGRGGERPGDVRCRVARLLARRHHRLAGRRVLRWPRGMVSGCRVVPWWGRMQARMRPPGRAAPQSRPVRMARAAGPRAPAGLPGLPGPAVLAAGLAGRGRRAGPACRPVPCHAGPPHLAAPSPAAGRAERSGSDFRPLPRRAHRPAAAGGCSPAARPAGTRRSPTRCRARAGRRASPPAAPAARAPRGCRGRWRARGSRRQGPPGGSSSPTGSAPTTSSTEGRRCASLISTMSSHSWRRRWRPSSCRARRCARGHPQAEILHVGDHLREVLLRADHQRVADRVVPGQGGQVAADLAFHALAAAGLHPAQPQLHARADRPGCRARNCGGPRRWPHTSSSAAAAGRCDPAPHSAGLEYPGIIPGNGLPVAGAVNGHRAISPARSPRPRTTRSDPRDTALPSRRDVTSGQPPP